MKLEDYKSLTPFEKAVFDSVSKMEQYLKSIYNIITADEAERYGK